MKGRGETSSENVGEEDQRAFTGDQAAPTIMGAAPWEKREGKGRRPGGGESKSARQTYRGERKEGGLKKAIQIQGRVGEKERERKAVTRKRKRDEESDRQTYIAGLREGRRKGKEKEGRRKEEQDIVIDRVRDRQREKEVERGKGRQLEERVTKTDRKGEKGR